MEVENDYGREGKTTTKWNTTISHRLGCASKKIAHWSFMNSISCLLHVSSLSPPGPPCNKYCFILILSLPFSRTLYFLSLRFDTVSSAGICFISQNLLFSTKVHESAYWTKIGIVNGVKTNCMSLHDFACPRWAIKKEKAQWMIYVQYGVLHPSPRRNCTICPETA